MLDGPQFWDEALDMADGKFNDLSVQPAPVVHVLAVDDSIVDRLVIQRLLMACSYKVTVVDSASRALEFLGLSNPSNANGLDVNLIITDYGMPGMTGYDLLKKLKETSAFKEIPVVIVSSENVPSRTNMCLAEGAEEFLMKPLQKSDIERLQDQIIEPRVPYMMQSSNLRRKNGSNGVNHASCDAIIKAPLESCKESSRFNTNSPPRHRRLSLDNLHSPYPQHRAQAAFYAEI